MTASDLARDLADAADAADADYHRARHRAVWRRRLLPAVGIATVLILWAAAVYVFNVPPFIAPSPLLVVTTLYAKFPILITNLIPTAIEAVSGFLLGNLTAIVIATVFVHKKTMEEAFFPIVVIVNTIPVVAKAPILVLLLGNGMEPKIAIAALICFFPTLVISASTSVIGAIVGEWIGSTYGIGALIIQAMYNFDSAMLYATVIVGSVFSVAFFLVISFAERMIVRWQAPVAH